MLYPLAPQAFRIAAAAFMKIMQAEAKHKVRSLTPDT